jgi:hypothetical protein
MFGKTRAAAIKQKLQVPAIPVAFTPDFPLTSWLVLRSNLVLLALHALQFSALVPRNMHQKRETNLLRGNISCRYLLLSTNPGAQTSLPPRNSAGQEMQPSSGPRGASPISGFPLDDPPSLPSPFQGSFCCGISELINGVTLRETKPLRRSRRQLSPRTKSSEPLNAIQVKLLHGMQRKAWRA